MSGLRSRWMVGGLQAYEEEDTCMPCEDEDTCMPCEEEDTCLA
jgi:hypothetical protein